MAASEYYSSLNGGQLSPLLNSRNDLDVYRNGCSTLRNFFVLPQGGVERRPGTQYLTDAISEDGRLIPFIFSRDTSYTVEVTDTVIRILDGAGAVLKSLTSPYSVADIPDIKYKQISDILIMVTPNAPIQRISRINLDPLDFIIEEVTFDYPPLREENEDRDITITPKPIEWEPLTVYVINEQIQEAGILYYCNTDHTSSATFAPDVANWSLLYQEGVSVNTGEEIILSSNEDIFTTGMEGAYMRLRYPRTEATVASSGSLTVLNETSDEVFVDGEKYTVSITNYSGNVRLIDAKSVIETNTGSGWTTKQAYNTNGAFTYEGTGLVNERIRVRKSNDFVSTGTNYSIGLASNRRVSDSFLGNNTSAALDVSFSNWEVTTGGTWNGTVELEVSTDRQKTWSTATIIGDTTSVNENNFTVASPFREGADTFIRVKYTGADTLEYNIHVTSAYAEGLARVIGYIDDSNVIAEVISTLGGSGGTFRWTEGAFSARRGYPNSIELWDDRVAYGGSFDDPSVTWLSGVGDYYNYQLGTEDTNSIKVVPTTNEPTTWLLAKDVLYQGTRGSLVVISSVDGKAITPTNIQANEAVQFSGSETQGLKTNETVVYLERLNQKLREVVFSDEEQGLVTRDLTILSNEISADGFSELALQRTPEQIIHGVRSDGMISSFTYERSQDVKGWAILNLGGIVKSITVRPTGAFDELWCIITRSNGTFIEKIGTRRFSDDLLDAWYIDSGIKSVLIENQDADTVTIDQDAKVMINKVAHGLLDGDQIKITNVAGLESIDNQIMVVADKTNDTFILKTLDGNYLDMSFVTQPSSVTPIGAGDAGWNTTLPYSSDQNGKPAYGLGSFNDLIFWTGSEWRMITGLLVTAYTNPTDSKYPPASGWVPASGTPPAPSDITLNFGTLDVNFTQVSNTWGGLTHLEGETVQVQGDGGFSGEYTVVSGSITTDYFYNQTVIGLRFLSIWQPMFVEAGAFSSFRSNKSVLDAVIRFYRTISGFSGIIIQGDDYDPTFDFDTLEEEFPNLSLEEYDYEPLNFRQYTDALGAPIIPKNGTKLVNYNDTYSRVKSMFVIQGLPMPMTLQSASFRLSIGGN